ncbi:MAG: 4-hydroxy-3-methylbut-2-enyl diphosphate reductase, partial [Bacillota bacterium]|nr:4-hydroxy-3-methylbut-2-enyl diphosphate reductase [Bacillota bacterium]
MADRLIADPPPESPIYMLGSLIHNRQVIRELNEQGMRTANSTDEVETGSTVLIRAHGVTPATLCELEKKNCNIVNCTCPFVTKIHRIVRQAYLKGSRIIIAGTPGHAEVEGINGECNGEGIVISSSEEAEKHQFSENHWILVAQTTFSFAEYQNICVILKKKIAKLQIFDTICITTEDRQREACEIAKQADMMFVIGSQGSSNTQKLLSICLGQCRWTYLVEDATQVGSMVGERSLRDLTVGITAGASTPERIIREVIQAMTEQEVKQNKQEIQAEIQQDVQEEVKQDADQMVENEDNQEAVAVAVPPVTGSAAKTDQEQPAAEAPVEKEPEAVE